MKKTKKKLSKMSGKKSTNYTFKTLDDITQFDWEKVTETGDLSIVNIDEENYFFLIDELSKLLGTERNIKLEMMKLKRLYKRLYDYAISLDSTTEMYYKLELAEQTSKDKEESSDLTPYITKAYGYINKREISVKDYTQLYIALRDGKINL